MRPLRDKAILGGVFVDEIELGLEIGYRGVGLDKHLAVGFECDVDRRPDVNFRTDSQDLWDFDW